VADLPPHKKFEWQIERIHQLLEVEGSIVTWDDHIPDPDNPSQPRQIDVSIRRDGSLTLIECRIHKQPQDVTWIEELMGRRISLNADAVIAVSASGFTITAREKANRHGIHLRDFETLSREEIQNWRRRRSLTLSFCEFTQVTVTIRAAGVHGNGLNAAVVRNRDCAEVYGHGHVVAILDDLGCAEFIASHLGVVHRRDRIGVFHD
jgi:Restriction endonuclease